MEYNIITAMNENGLIGVSNDLPWGRIPEDLEYFQQITKNNIVVMGRKTWESIPIHYRPLKKRINIILTKSTYNLYTNNTIIFNDYIKLNDIINFSDTSDIEDDLIFIVNSLELLQNLLEQLTQIYENKKIFIIGGSTLYKQFIEHTNTLYITQINYKDTPLGAVYFPYTLSYLLSSNLWNLLHKTNWTPSKKFKKYQLRFLTFNRHITN